MGRFANTWRLTKNSWSLLKQDRELLWLPVLSMLTILAIAAAAAVVGFVTGSFDTSGGAESVQGSAAVLGLVFAFVATATVVYFEGALVAGAHERMTGGDPTVRSAMGKAASRLPSLLGWALITLTVGLVLRFLRERPGLAGPDAHIPGRGGVGRGHLPRRSRHHHRRLPVVRQRQALHVAGPPHVG
ncbi:DUF6159 family protein [Candidatus Poriferisodalis sp.]|uniref:DUF6159 family protein n=1 Tax=Candidatus Poriferisodalis sp. TaxID=3101277 RepID=UPI003B020E6B